MSDLPDAPWIVEAETDGMPEAEPFICPECGAEDPERVYTIHGQHGRQSIVGCSECVDDWAVFTWKDWNI